MLHIRHAFYGLSPLHRYGAEEAVYRGVHVWVHQQVPLHSTSGSSESGVCSRTGFFVSELLGGAKDVLW